MTLRLIIVLLPPPKVDCSRSRVLQSGTGRERNAGFGSVPGPFSALTNTGPSDEPKKPAGNRNPKTTGGRVAGILRRWPGGYYSCEKRRQINIVPPRTLPVLSDRPSGPPHGIQIIITGRPYFTLYITLYIPFPPRPLILCTRSRHYIGIRYTRPSHP